MDPSAPDRPVRAVIIDDAADIRDLMTIVLTRSGMRVVGTAPDGRAGVELVRAERPDLVLLDLAMPVMDGVEALPLIRELVPDGRIVVLSAFAGPMREQMLASGADGYVEKGTPLKEIVAHLESTLAR